MAGPPPPADRPPNLRIGWGYDIHRLYDGYPTVLGGVRFPDFPRGFNTHSDGDVVAHAIIDALAGALAIGSLGDYFPEDDPADQDARSIEFLRRFRPVMKKHRAEVINLDCTIFCAAPRIGPVAVEMRNNIAAGIECEVDRVNVKGKTNDGFGPEGELYPDVVDGLEEEGGVPSRLLKTDMPVLTGRKARQWKMFAGSLSGRIMRSRSRWMSSRVRVRVG